MATVRIYTTPTCPYCHAALGLLRAKKIPFEQVDVWRDPAMRARLVELTGRSTVPQIFIDDRPIGGFTDMLALERRGELDPMLEPSNT